MNHTDSHRIDGIDQRSDEMSPRIPKIKFRNLREHEIPRILELCAKEGRHMGIESEIRTWFKIDGDGFFVAATEEGEIVGSCVAIRLSPFHGNIGMFVVEQKYRGSGIGTTIWSKAINHLGEDRNKGLSAVPNLFHIYVDKAHFNKIAPWDIILFKLEGKRLLANLTDILKSDEQSSDEQLNSSIISDEDDYENNFIDETQDPSDNDSNDSGNRDDDLKSVIENEELNTNSFNHKNSKNSRKSSTHVIQLETNYLKDIAHEDNFRNKANNLSVWIKKKSDSNLINNFEFRTVNQLIYYSKPYHTHLNSFSNYSTVVLHNKPSSPSISLPSLLNSDTLDIFDRNRFKNYSNISNHRLSSGKPFDNLPQNLLYQINSSHNNHNNSPVRIISYTGHWLQKLIEYDIRLNGYSNRAKIVSLSVNEENSNTKLAVIDSIIVGYAICKHSLQDVYMIAPLYSNSRRIANNLIKGLIRSMSIEQLAKGFIIKLPNCNRDAIELMNELGFERQNNYLVTRCFTDYVHKTDTKRIFALQSTIFSSE